MNGWPCLGTRVIKIDPEDGRETLGPHGSSTPGWSDVPSVHSPFTVAALCMKYFPPPDPNQD